MNKKFNEALLPSCYPGEKVLIEVSSEREKQAVIDVASADGFDTDGISAFTWREFPFMFFRVFKNHPNKLGYVSARGYLDGDEESIDFDQWMALVGESGAKDFHVNDEDLKTLL